MLEDKIPVQIFGQNFEIVGNSTETLYYNSLARFVEDKMKDIMRSTNVVSTQKVAILAALNIADELFRDRENKSLGGKNTDKRMEDILKQLDGAIREPADEPKASLPKPQVIQTGSALPQEFELI